MRESKGEHEMIWIGLVQRNLKHMRGGDSGYVYPFDDEPEVYEPETVTNTLAFISPCENDVAVYRGSFQTRVEAECCIRDWFPAAAINVTE
jgi:hypothetical protein